MSTRFWIQAMDMYDVLSCSMSSMPKSVRRGSTKPMFPERAIRVPFSAHARSAALSRRVLRTTSNMSGWDRPRYMTLPSGCINLKCRLNLRWKERCVE